MDKKDKEDKNKNVLINKYVKKLVNNLPDEITKGTTQSVDVILDGGAFNGCYLLGALYFLKEMEKRNYIKVNRISGCSVGSVAAFFYMIDRLDLMEYFHNYAVNEIQTNYCLEKLIDYDAMFKNKFFEMPANICEIVNKRLFITYNNIIDKKTVVKSTYKNGDDVMETVVKSCYVPFLVGNSLLYKGKYMDGINPHMFSLEKHKNRKIIYLDLFGYDKFKYMINVKNEKCGFHRILSGLLDIHNFYIKQSSTDMCSYVNDWSIFHKTRHFLKKVLEQLILYSMYFILILKKCIPISVQESLMYIIVSKIIYEVYLLILQTYCL